MSIKTFHTPQGDRILFFLILSILMHMAVVWALTSGGWLKAFSRPRTDPYSPITVDVVRLPESRAGAELPRTIVKLPPVETQDLSKEKKPSTHISDRSQSVEKEVYPAPDLTPAARPAAPKQATQSAPAKQAKQAKQAKGESGGGAGEKGPARLAPALEGEDTYPAGASGAGTGATGRVKKPGETIIVPPKPNLFLTEDRISELIHKYESEPQKGERGKILQLNTSESKYAEYVTESLVPPIEFRMSKGLAARKGWLGNLLIDFTVNKDGSLGTIDLVKSSGNPALDDDTITSLKLASPFPPLPEKFDMEEITIRGIFVYY